MVYSSSQMDATIFALSLLKQTGPNYGDWNIFMEDYYSNVFTDAAYHTLF